MGLLHGLHEVGGGEGVLAHQDHGHAEHLGAVHDDVVGVQVAREHQAGAVSLQGHELQVGAVATEDDRRVLLPLEVGEEVLHLHGADEEGINEAITAGRRGEDAAAQALGQVGDLHPGHERITRDEAEHVHATALQRGGDHVLGLVHVAVVQIVEHRAHQLVALRLQDILGGEYIVVVQPVVETVQQQGLDAQGGDHGRTVHGAVAPGVQEAARAADEHDVLVLRELLVGLDDDVEQALARGAEGLGLEVTRDEHGGDQCGIVVQPKHLLHEEGVFVALLAVLHPGHGPDRLHVADLQALLLQLEAKGDGHEVLAGELSTRAYVQTDHYVLRVLDVLGRIASAPLF